MEPTVATPARRDPAWPWTRVAIAYALLEWALWTTGWSNRIASLAFLTWVIVTTILQRKPWRELGLGSTGFAGASFAIAVALVAGGTIVLLGHACGTLRPLYGANPVPHALLYSLWAMLQQFILNSFFFLTLEEVLLRSRDAAIGAVVLFTLAHIPNPVLLAGTFALSALSVALFRRYRNVYPLGIAHAILGLSVALAVPDALVRHMRVGIGYFHFAMK